MKVLVSGATGLIGKAVTNELKRAGHEITTLSRKPAGGAIGWQPKDEPAPVHALESARVIIHLAGEPIAERRWTEEVKRGIRDSRVIGTRNLIRGIESAATRPALLVCASAVGYYGSRGDEVLDEASSPGHGFLPDVCVEWEGEAMRAEQFGVRVVQMRTGLVLSTDGGALAKMLPPFRLGIGGRLGSGTQWVPWVHIADVAGIVMHSIENESLRGPINIVAPGIVTNAQFTSELASVLDRAAFLPVPEFALKFVFGEMAELLLSSQRVTPRAAVETGYSFQFTELAAALKDLLLGALASRRR
jgi:uncharacterized protein